MENYKKEREKMIKNLIGQGYMKSPRIIEAFKGIPRHVFIPEKYRQQAYSDIPLPIGFGQTISAPHMHATYTELLEPRNGDKILEVGAGSGYQAALLSDLVKSVVTIELERGLADVARANLSKLGIKNVLVLNGDGSKGFPKESPYEKIIVACACKEIPHTLVNQLKEGGKIIAPVGGHIQTLIVGIKKGKKLEKQPHGGCVFVPMRQ